jgi:hypothetical protein
LEACPGDWRITFRSSGTCYLESHPEVIKVHHGVIWKSHPGNIILALEEPRRITLESSLPFNHGVSFLNRWLLLRNKTKTNKKIQKGMQCIVKMENFKNY